MILPVDNTSQKAMGMVESACGVALGFSQLETYLHFCHVVHITGILDTTFNLIILIGVKWEA